MRNLYGPKINPADYALSVGKGGTGRMNLSEAADALQLVKNSTKGQPNGPIALSSAGQIDPAKLPALSATNQINLIGSFTPVINATITWQISDYDSFKSYPLSATAGTISRSGDTVTYVAPATPQTVTVSIAGRSIPVVVTPVQPSAPVISSPVNGATNIPVSPTLTASAFVANGSGTHASSDWQIATDAGFTAIVASSIADVTNKTSWTSSKLTGLTTYYARCRYKASNGNYSDYSSVVQFQTQVYNALNTEEAKLAASDKVASDLFGTSISISGDGSRVVVGSVNATVSTIQSGAAYIFLRTGTSWAQEAKVTATDKAAGDGFGNSVTISSDGTRIAVGSPSSDPSGATNAGAVYTFTRSGSTWTQEQKLVGTDAAASDQFGWSLSFTYDSIRLAIGAYQKSPSSVSNCGQAYIFLRTGTTWAQEATLLASDKVAGDNFGNSIAISGDGTRVIVGSFNASISTATNCGAAYVYVRSGVTWTQEQKLSASDKTTNDNFGQSVSMDNTGTRAVVGSASTVSGFSQAGAVYAFIRNTTTWTQEQKIVATDPASSALVGRSVSLSSDGARVAMGAYNAQKAGVATGVVYIASRSGSVWTQEQRLTPSDGIVGDAFGWSVSIAADASRVVTGCRTADPGGTSNAGAAYVYR